MVAAHVRTHPGGASAAQGTSVAATIATTPVAAGNTLVAWVAANGGRDVASLTKPAGETATWTRIGHVGTASSGDLWAIKTTIPWPIDTTITATFGGAQSSFRTIQLAEFSGVDVVLRGPATLVGAGLPYAYTPFTAISADGYVGDLVIAAATSHSGLLDWQTDPGFSFRPDTDTVRGAWGSAGAGKAFAVNANPQNPSVNGVFTILQWKVLVGDGSQAYDVAVRSSGGYSYLDREAGAVVAVLRSAADPPNAPTLLTMADGGVVDRARTNRARHRFSDPNYADSQSAFDIRYRPVGDPNWTTLNVVTPNDYYDFPPGSLIAADYERQVRTYDSLGIVGPWSPSGFFTAADTPPGPAITYPFAGQQLDEAERIDWATPDQDAYQVRRVADDGTGSPDEDVVHFDSGEVSAPTIRSLPLTFETNERPEHVQLRVKFGGLWSPWTSVDVEVSYTPPPVPTFVLYADQETASIIVDITNPLPTGDAPAAAYNDVYVDDGRGEERKATGVPVSGAWRYWTPVSGRDYAASVRVVAVAPNGTTAASS